jgi:hypothetical protein
MNRLFCCAYYAGFTVNDAPLIAKHGMAIMSLYTGRFNNLAVIAEIKRLNPAIKILVYVQAAAQDWQETVPALALQKAHPLAWLPDQIYEPRRLFSDYRSNAWHDGIQAAVDATLAFPLIDGVFLDNVSVWAQHVRAPDAGPRMAEGLQRALSEMRRRHPQKIIIANSASQWTDVNGEMNENRPDDWSQLRQDRRHTQPEMRLALVYASDEARVAELYAKAKAMGLWFGAAADPTLQTVRWWDAYGPVTDV